VDTSADGSQEAPEGPRVVKRYANRKLYDTRDSKYVTLQQIAEFVRVGEDVRIIDNKTKEDLTNVTLAQIIYEEQKKGDGQGKSGRTLRKIIQSGERLMTTLRDGTVVGKLVQREDGEPLEDGMVEELGPDSEFPAATATDSEAPTRDSESPKKSVVAQSKEALGRLADDRMRALLGTALGSVQQLQSEVGRLQTRIEELEDRLVKLTRRSGDSEAPKKNG